MPERTGGMLCRVNSPARIGMIALMAPALWGQSQLLPIVSPAIFPTLSYGPDAWSILTLANPAGAPKTVKVDVFRSSGERLPIGPLYTLQPGGTVDIRIDGPHAALESCWARIEDVSRRRSRPGLEAAAREERLQGDRLEVFSQTVARTAVAGRWLSPAGAVGGKSLFFLNISDKSAAIGVCATDDPRLLSCRRDGSVAPRVTVNPRQSVVLKVRRVGKQYLLIESTARIPSIVGILRSESGTSRVFSTESAIDFDDPAQ